MSSSEIEFKSWREFLPPPPPSLTPPSVTMNKDAVVLRFVSEKCPSSSCSFKINIKDDADDSQLTKYESPLFSSGGQNWKLIVYPKGNEEDNGKGFVSMYVELDSSSSSMDVFAYISFFVYNKKENKYLCFQDVEVKRFNSSKTVWGLSQVIPLKTFKGYASDGEGYCEFGAHVKVASPDVFVSEQNLPFHKFLFSFRDFSLLNENSYVSKCFSMKERNWKLKMYPKGDPIAIDRMYPSGEYITSDGLSLYLYLDDREVLSRGQMISVRQNLKALDPRGPNHKTASSQGWVMPSNRAHSFSLAIDLKTLKEICVDDEDTFNVEVEFESLKEIISPFFN